MSPFAAHNQRCWSGAKGLSRARSDRGQRMKGLERKRESACRAKWQHRFIHHDGQSVLYSFVVVPADTANRLQCECG